MHRETVTNILLNHTYFTKIAFIEGKSEKSLGNLNFLNQFSTINVHSRVTKDQILKKKNVNENFI